MKILIALLFTALVSAEAHAQSAAQTGYTDPGESINRIIFKGNVALDDVVLEPIAKGYRAITTPPIRSAISNLTSNLDEPRSFINALLQGDFIASGNALTRFVINSTFGIAGIFDIAGAEKVAAREEDFGQTLAVWGLNSGPYIMLPLFGPSNARDTVGRVVDILTSPIGFMANRFDAQVYDYSATGASIIAFREKNIDNIAALRRSTLDYYAAVRGFSWQQRQNAITNSVPGDDSRTRDKAFENF